MISKRLLYALLVVFCAWLGYYQLERYWQPDVQVSPDNEKPVFIGNNVSNTTFDLSGSRKYQIDAKHLEYFNVSKQTDFVKPVLVVFQNGSTAEWRISSNTGELTKDKVLHLVGDVRIFNLLPDSSIQLIQTDNLWLNLVSNDFGTEDHVTITGPELQNQGDGLKGNMKSHEATLLNNVKAIYEPIKN